MMLRTAGDDNSGDAPARITDSASGFYAPTWSADTNTHMRIARREAAGCSYPHSCKARNHAARNGGKRTCQPFLHPNELRRAQQSELFWKPIPRTLNFSGTSFVTWKAFSQTRRDLITSWSPTAAVTNWKRSDTREDEKGLDCSGDR